ncbi:hypothetical protein ECH_1085 [Ehrlichia chaffeensis str. Arkansas]|uniref:Uncharacterized protein n=1 Tax=Ehrlichia chaffeensis (strain ATCC CRL-10679 / Arkansas) TaxID=205920 RepID=Q2GFB3_EHRCR|nr:hypothetical protein ECH_1085 [Ehrlichia chaffeensis str. Arkansas]
MCIVFYDIKEIIDVVVSYYKLFLVLKLYVVVVTT